MERRHGNQVLKTSFYFNNYFPCDGFTNTQVNETFNDSVQYRMTVSA